MTVGAQRQAHAPSRAADPAVDHSDARVEAVLADPSRAPEQNVRLDLSPEWGEVTLPVSDFASLASIAGLVRDDLLRQQLKSEQREGHVVLHLLQSQVTDFVWIIDQLAYLGRQASEACDRMEEILAEQNPRVRARREREGRP